MRADPLVVDTPITYRYDMQLVDPFFGAIKLSNVLVGSAQWLAPTQKNYKNIKRVLNEDDKSIQALNRRMNFYKNASDLQAMRRRAYEYAYIEFKKKVVEIPQGSNAGPSITQPRFGLPSYQSKGGLPNGGAGAAWCACFTAWCYDNAGFNIPSGFEIGRVGEWKARFKKVSNLYLLEPGDLVIYGGNDHVGLFSKWLIPPRGGKGVFSSIEGNTQLDVIFKISKDSKGNYTRTYFDERTIQSILRVRKEKGLTGTKDSQWVAGRRRIYPTEFLVETNDLAEVEFYRIDRGYW